MGGREEGEGELRTREVKSRRMGEWFLSSLTNYQTNKVIESQRFPIDTINNDKYELK